MPFLAYITVCVLVVLASLAFRYIYRSRGDSSRIPERAVWYLGVAVLVFFVLTYGARANEPSVNLLTVFVAFAALSAIIALQHTIRAIGNLLNHMAQTRAQQMRHRNHHSERSATAG